MSRVRGNRRDPGKRHGAASGTGHLSTNCQASQSRRPYCSREFNDDQIGAGKTRRGSSILEAAGLLLLTDVLGKRFCRRTPRDSSFAVVVAIVSFYRSSLRNVTASDVFG